MTGIYWCKGDNLYHLEFAWTSRVYSLDFKGVVTGNGSKCGNRKKNTEIIMFSWGIFEKVYTEWGETQHYVQIWPIAFKKIVMK